MRQKIQRVAGTDMFRTAAADIDVPFKRRKYQVRKAERHTQKNLTLNGKNSNVPKIFF